MRILADQRIRALFSRIGICIGVFISLSAVMSISLGAKAQLLGIFLTSLCTAAAILTFCSIYFREQDKILEDAAAQIKDYIAGDLDARIACDRIWLTEALENIVKNALDHTQAGDSIQIKWRQLVSMLQITVRDNGSGIHPEDLYHIFKRFYRSRFSKDTKGIGLGLPLAKSIIEMHGGTVGVDSEWGRGTVFVINFLIPTKL